MAQRKIFTDNSGKELSYLISEDKLRIEIHMVDGTNPGISLDYQDAISFIQELNKLRKDLK